MHRFFVSRGAVKVNRSHFIVVIMIVIKIMIVMIVMIAIIIVVNNKSRLFEQVENHLRQYGLLLNDVYKPCVGTSLKLHQNKCFFAISIIAIVLRG